MTKSFFRLSTFMLLLSTIFMTSCGEDGVTIPTVPGANGPTARLVAGADLISNDADLNAGSSFKVQLTASPGDALLKTITIFENGTKVAIDRIEYNGDPAAANPRLIVLESEKAGFTYDITISYLPAGVNNYEFEVGDDDNLVTATSVNVTGNSEPLAINLQQSGTYDNVEVGSLVAIPVTAKSGVGIATLSVSSGGAFVDASNLAFKTATPASTFTSNPLTLAAEDQNGFEGNVYIRATNGNNTYTIALTDTAGETASVDVTINAGTPLSGELMGVFFNASGPNKGGLNLYNGESVSTVPLSADAQIIDLGISNGPAASNWLQEVKSVNSANLRLPAADQPEGFKYENISSREAIIAAFDSAGDNVESTGKLAEGDIILVENDGDYFIIQFARVVMTTTDNKDFYEVNIKQAIQ